MVSFAGWLMPVQYAGVLEEHRAVRTSCGIFDVGHMGTVFLRGPGASEFLQRTLTNDVTRAAPGRAQYTMLCNDAGGVVDDLIVSHLDDEEWMVVPNAANVAAVVAALRECAPANVAVDDVSPEWGIIAIQGPRHAEVLAGALPGVSAKRFAVHRFDTGGLSGVVSGTGYTGEPGVEVVAPLDTVLALWDPHVDGVAEVGGRPAGLGARDTLRTEMGYPLHGQDISPTISPLEAGLGWVVKLDKGGFPGRDALGAQRKAGVPRRLAGLLSPGRQIARTHTPVLDIAGSRVGEVTSGNFSPTLERGVALALLTTGTEPAAVEVRGSIVPVEAVDPPFISRP